VQAPQAICEITATNVNRTMLINPNTPAFDKREPRQAMALSLDRQVFIDILARG
jgi:peptide/nickel transport system substrate-binding protein